MTKTGRRPRGRPSRATAPRTTSARPSRSTDAAALCKGGAVGDARPFVILGAGAVVAGGLVAAASSVAPSAHASWAAGYLVLVAGVAQVLPGVPRPLERPALSVPAGVLLARAP
jgi:hypothetical protein